MGQTAVWVLFVALSSTMHAPVWAQSHKGLTFQGYLKDASGTVVTASSVAITSKLVSPNGCVLLQETHSGVNLVDGFFTVVIGKGVRGGSDRGLPLKDVFSNSVSRTALDPVSGTAGSCNYAPSAHDARTVALEFSLGADTIKADFNVRASAFAVWAESSEDASKLDGKTASAFLQTNSGAGLTQVKLEEFIAAMTSMSGGAVRWNGSNFVAYNPSDASHLSSGSVTDTQIHSVAWSKLTAVPSALAQIGGLSCADGKILKRVSGVWACADDGGGGGGGTATDLSTITGTGIVQRDGANAYSTLGVSAPITNTVGSLGLAVGAGLTLASGSLVPDFGSASGQVAQGNDARFPAGNCASGNKMRFENGAWVCETDLSSDSTKVAKSGDTMTGALSLPGNGLVVGTNQLVVSGGNVGIGTATPSVSLETVGEIKVGNSSTACDASTEGAIRYNSSTKRMEFCNATEWQQFSQGVNASVSIGAPSSSLVSTTDVTYTVTYGSGTDTNTIILSPSHISISGSDTSGCTAAVSGSGSSRLVTLSGCSGTGTVTISVDPNSAQSTTGNSAAAAGPATPFQVDNTGPSAVTGISLGSVPSNLTSSPAVTYSAATDTGGSSVASYQIRVLRSSDNTEMKAWGAHTSGSAVSGLSLAATTNYFCEIRAVDGLGNLGAVATSPEWTSTSLPCGSLANIKSISAGGVITCSDDSTLSGATGMSWNGGGSHCYSQWQCEGVGYNGGPCAGYASTCPINFTYGGGNYTAATQCRTDWFGTSQQFCTW